LGFFVNVVRVNENEIENEKKKGHSPVQKSPHGPMVKS
jgi:hypothetical protein